MPTMSRHPRQRPSPQYSSIYQPDFNDYKSSDESETRENVQISKFNISKATSTLNHPISFDLLHPQLLKSPKNEIGQKRKKLLFNYSFPHTRDGVGRGRVGF